MLKKLCIESYTIVSRLIVHHYKLICKKKKRLEATQMSISKGLVKEMIWWEYSVAAQKEEEAHYD